MAVPSTPSRGTRLLAPTQHRSRLQQPVLRLIPSPTDAAVETEKKKKKKKGSLRERPGDVGRRSCIDDSCMPFNSLVALMVCVIFENNCNSSLKRKYHSSIKMGLNRIKFDLKFFLSCSCYAKANQGTDEGGWAH